jgi:hypothetical protein
MDFPSTLFLFIYLFLMGFPMWLMVYFLMLQSPVMSHGKVASFLSESANFWQRKIFQ